MAAAVDSGRRLLLGGALAAGCAAAAGSIVLGIPAARADAVRWRPRPPGALQGRRFTAACARCGQCVAACPYDALRLAGLLDPAPLGTPWFEPRKEPCRMCRDLPCVKACPTGALDPALEDVRDARMGVAVVDSNACLSWQGLRCEVCLRECPENGRALTIEARPRGLSKHAVFTPVVHPDACTGCGLCEKGCPTEVPSIRVADPAAVLGSIGRHYRLGWLSEDDPKNLRREGPPETPMPAAGAGGGLPDAPGAGEAGANASDGAEAAALDYLNAGEL